MWACSHFAEVPGYRIIAFALLLCVAFSAAVRGQAVDPTGRIIAEIRVEGVDADPQQLVRNQLTTEVGQAYDPPRIARDIENITRLGRFDSVRTTIQQQADGSLILSYIVQPRRLLEDVQTVGNKMLTDQEILAEAQVRGGDPADEFLIRSAIDRIEDLYESEGYFASEVTVDEDVLERTGVLIFKVREGPRPRIRDVQVVGNRAFSEKELKSKIETNRYIWLFDPGSLSRQRLQQDTDILRQFYMDRGYLDARVFRQISLSDDWQSAVIRFVVEENEQYTVGDITFENNTQFSDAALIEAMALKRGEVYSAPAVREAVESIYDLYGKVGYLSVQEGGMTAVNIQRVFDPDEPRVNLNVRIEEGERYLVGEVLIRGNRRTQEHVVRREIRNIEPGRPYDRTGIAQTENRLERSGLFRNPRITVQGEPEDEVRDMLVEVDEERTGSISIGGAISSDAGVLGAIDMNQRNFDITDFPESWGELFRGQAFRGAGQRFSLSLQPGVEFQRYSVSFSEPSIFDSDYFLDTGLFFFSSERENYEESRFGGRLGLGKRFGDHWSARVDTRLTSIEISDIDPEAPVDVFAVEGNNFVESVGLTITRSTVDVTEQLLPYRGSRFSVGVDRFGLLGGDFEFTRATAEWTTYFTLAEDFFGRKTTLKLHAEAGYIFEDNEAPVFDRFYAGGHTSFRGFAFRGVGPRGIQNNTGTLGDDPIGGDWLFLAKAEYNFPVYERFLRAVVFMDTGTVQDDIGFDEYRVSIGTGVRITLPFLGQAPLAFDIAYPLLAQEDDEEQLFSFSLAIPLQ